MRMSKIPWWRRPELIALALALATVLVYLPVFQNELVNYDDDYYISQNPNLKLGLSGEGLKWAFLESYGANWYPLTWLSLMLDVELFGMSAAAFHGVNLTFHVASAVLLFAVFLRMTGSVGGSGFVAAIFTLHPLHVESVAWAAERKDVLSALFWMLTLWAYARYADAHLAELFRPLVGGAACEDRREVVRDDDHEDCAEKMAWAAATPAPASAV